LATAGYPYYRAIVSAGVQPRERAELNVRIPDLAVTSEPIGPDTRLLRNPILLVEVIEPWAIADAWANIRS
jgi:hypothetical protein